MPKWRYPYAERATRYAKQVTAGKKAAPRLVRLACQRHLDDIEAAKKTAYPYRWDKAKANRFGEFAERMVHVKGKWAGQNIQLEDWQCFCFCVPFGWIRKADGMRRFREIYEEIPRKNAKALAIDTEIPTPGGFSRMEDIHPGSLVFGVDGKPCRVVAESKIFTDHECYEVEFSTGEVIVADAGHLWVTDSRQDRDRLKGVKGKTAGPKPSIKTTKEIANSIVVRGERNHRVRVALATEIPEADLPIDPYFLGAWLGDGHTNAARITAGDQEIFDRIEAGGARVGTVYGGERHKTKTFLGVLPRLREIGVLGNKHIPANYLFSSRRQRLELLCGMMDTDGSVSKAGQCSFTSINKILAGDFATLVASLGWKPSTSTGKAKLNGRVISDVYRVQFWPYRGEKVFYVSRKAARLKARPAKKTRAAYRQIVRADRIGSVPVKCIQVDSPDGQFLVGRSYIPTHNSTLGAIVGNYLAFADGEAGAEVYSGATTEKQAFEVFRPAWLMVKRNPEFRQHFGLDLGGTDKNPGTIFRLSDGSRFEPVIGKPGDGAAPHGALVDEYHEHNTPALYDTMKTGMGSRAQPMLWVITTGGQDTSAPCYAHRENCVKVLEGVLEDDELFAVIYNRDEKDDWKSFKVWRKANPNLGVSLFEDFLRGRHKEALQRVERQNINRCKHLNDWMNAGTGWMNMAKWAECARPGFDPVKAAGSMAAALCGWLEITPETLKATQAWLGVDLASKIDVASLVGVLQFDGKWAMFARHYLPEDTVDLPHNVHYQRWRDQGWLTVTDGARTDFHRIEEEIQALAGVMAVQELAFDPKEASYLIQNIQAWASFTCVEITQGPAHMSEPMKETEALVASGELVHPDDPVFNWMISNVLTKTARGGGPVKYQYPTKSRNANKIDGPVALIMALGRAMVHKQPVESYYETHGLELL